MCSGCVGLLVLVAAWSLLTRGPGLLMVIFGFPASLFHNTDGQPVDTPTPRSEDE